MQSNTKFIWFDTYWVSWARFSLQYKDLDNLHLKNYRLP